MEQWLAIFLLLALPLNVFAIALLDWVIFSRWSKCEQCGAMPPRYQWVVACALETFCFLVGILSGAIAFGK